MKMNLDQPEKILFALRSLYDRHGYCRYRMNKFEEYDLYAQNKDFLISDHVLTFTDSDGKLMALKPDVTLSIVKNSQDSGGVQKLYYNENVYRVSKDTPGFREIMQIGLECLGQVDEWCICEVLELAAESLAVMGTDWVLNVSHLGLVTGLAASLGIAGEQKRQMLSLMAAKNRHELLTLCRENGLSDAQTKALTELAVAKGAPEDVIPALRNTLSGLTDTGPLDQLEALMEALRDTGLAEHIRIDFSVVDDVHYYNGIVFKGFVRGLPVPVLSGGQYDKLMQKMKRSARAIGFAVYTDLLERLEESRDDYDVDTLVIYDDSASLSDLRAWSKRLAGEGSVRFQRNQPENLRCRRVLKLEKGEVTILEDNA